MDIPLLQLLFFNTFDLFVIPKESFGLNESFLLFVLLFVIILSLFLIKSSISGVLLLISSFQRSEELSDAMEARGYDPSKKRTKYRILKFTNIDLYSLIGTTLVMTSIILIGIFSDNIVSLFWSLF